MRHVLISCKLVAITLRCKIEKTLQWAKKCLKRLLKDSLTSSLLVIFHPSNCNEAVKMKSRQTILCETCNHYLRNITKKMFYYHQQYHIKNCFTCDTCKLVFNSESLLNFHILKTMNRT
jgi:hypothetical protein